jgi:hypothetical protein
MEETLPRFHFEIVDGFRLEDPVGLVCKSEQQAQLGRSRRGGFLCATFLLLSRRSMRDKPADEHRDEKADRTEDC